MHFYNYYSCQPSDASISICLASNRYACRQSNKPSYSHPSLTAHQPAQRQLKNSANSKANKYFTRSVKVYNSLVRCIQQNGMKVQKQYGIQSYANAGQCRLVMLHALLCWRRRPPKRKQPAEHHLHDDDGKVMCQEQNDVIRKVKRLSIAIGIVIVLRGRPLVVCLE